MRKTNDTFMPSAVLDAIYDILSESICVADNEDIYFDDITWDIIRLLNEHDDVTTFLWEDVRNEDDTGGMFFISWTEGKRLFHEHYKYYDYDEDLRLRARQAQCKGEKIMAKFIKIKNHLINIDKVYDFELCDHTIFVSYSGCESDMCIEFVNRQEAALVFEDIPHLIDNNYIPQWVREASEPIPCKPEYFNPDYDYDELPF